MPGSVDQTPVSATSNQYRVAVAAAVLLPTLILLGIAYLYRDTSLTKSLTSVERYSTVFAAQTLKSFESFEFILKSIDERFGKKPADQLQQEAGKYAAELAILQSSLPQIAGMGVSDATGRLIISAPPARTDASIADREYWTAQKDQDRGTFISRPFIGRASGQETFSISRRRTTADGSFQGTIHINVEVSNFTDFWRGFLLGDEAPVAALIRDDGETLMRTRPGTPPRFPSESPVMKAIQEGGSVFRSVSEYDGQDRFVALNKVGSFPVYVGVGIAVPPLVTPSHLILMVCACLSSALLVMLLHKAKVREALLLHEEGLRTKVEEALRKQQHIQVLGSLASTVAHDFNNVLQSVQAGVKVMARSQPDSSRLKEVVTSRRLHWSRDAG